LAGRSKCVNREAPKYVPRAKRIAGGLGVPSCSDLGEGHVGIEVLDQTMIELPGVREGGMPRRNGQRKPGTTRGSPRRSRTAKALRISRYAVKSRCARGWGGWGRLSDDGSRQHNSGKSEDPWGGGRPNLQGGARSSARPDTVREYRCRRDVRERQTQTKHQPVYAGSRLKLVNAWEGAALQASLPAVSGKTRRTE
jgi:hypothetical protein